MLQDWRREAPQPLPDPRAGRWQGQPEGACQEPSTSASCAKGLILHRTLYIPACASSPFINSLQAAGSAGRRVCPGPNAALLSSPAVRTACRIHTQLFIHKTSAPVGSAQEITTQHCTQASCAFCCCSANQIRFPCCLIHFALIKSKFRNEGNSSLLWER